MWNWLLHRPSRRRREGQPSRRRRECQHVSNSYCIHLTILPLANLYIFLTTFKSFLVFNLILKSGAVLHLHLGWFYLSLLYLLSTTIVDICSRYSSFQATILLDYKSSRQVDKSRRFYLFLEYSTYFWTLDFDKSCRFFYIFW